MQQGNPIVIKELVFENSFILGKDLPKLGQKFIKKHIEKIYIDIVGTTVPPAPGMGYPPGMPIPQILSNILSQLVDVKIFSFAGNIVIDLNLLSQIVDVKNI